MLIDKPADFSSHDIIAITRSVLCTKTIGHSGTLDPMATGLLVLLIGREATKQQPAFLQLSKTYTATLKLGIQTDTWDHYGTVTHTRPVPALLPPHLNTAVQRLSGSIQQQIPPFSAKKIKGEKMYDLSRKGVSLAPRFNNAYVEWKSFSLAAPDEIDFTVAVSCGTYVRSLGYMLANQLGTVGHLCKLRRLNIGPYQVSDAVDGNLLKTFSTDDLYRQVTPL